MISQKILILLSILSVFAYAVPDKRTFEVDYINETFLKDGEPFQYVSGQFDYFRSHPDSWQRKLRTMRAAGLNTVATSIEWSLHNPKENIYKWDGIADIERFIQLAAIEDLFVIIRPGPFISGERDLGGLPFWLLKKYPQIQMRTSDEDYINENEIWFSELMKRIEPYLYGNMGPVIIVQVENDYAAFSNCDPMYFKWLKNEISSYVTNKAVLFSYPGASCTSQDEILTSLGVDGPQMNIEYYVGWKSIWRKPMAKTLLDTRDIIENKFKNNENINFYMFYGGTNFGFTAGGYTDGEGNYESAITSYDFDAPMDEAGDPTDKYFILRNIIRKYLPIPNITIPTSIPKKTYGSVELTPKFSLLSQQGREISDGTILSENPLSFEALNQKSGLVLYETKLPTMKRDPWILTVDKIRDRGYIYVDNQFIGILSRSQPINELTIVGDVGTTLQIVVESQGRSIYNTADQFDFKGILGDVSCDGQILTNWSMTTYPFEDYNKILTIIKEQKPNLELPKKINKDEYEDDYGLNVNNKIMSDLMQKIFYHSEILKRNTISFKINGVINLNKVKENLKTEKKQKIEGKLLSHGPVIFYGELYIDENDIGDTYLDTTGWGKGFIFINNFNLGRYWVTVGPQNTLYVPSEILKPGVNEIILVEYQKMLSPKITFVNTPNFDFE